MEKDYDLSDSKEMDRRKEAAEEFYGALFDSEEWPYFVSDEANLYHIFVGDEDQLIYQCKSHYGVKINRSDFDIPFWQLLDKLNSKRQP